MSTKTEPQWDPDFVAKLILGEHTFSSFDWPGHQCEHERAPWVKSHYSDEKVQRGICPDCGCHLLELD